MIDDASTKAVVREALRTDFEALDQANDAWKRDRDTLLQAVADDYRTLTLVPDDLPGELMDALVDAARPTAVAAVAARWTALGDSDMPEVFRGDREVMLAAITAEAPAGRNWAHHTHAAFNALKYATAADLLEDREIMTAAVERDFHALQFAADDLKRDRDLLKCAVQQDWEALHSPLVPDDLKDDPEILGAARPSALAAVRASWSSLKTMPDEFKSDQEIVLAAVQSTAPTGGAWRHNLNASYQALKFASDDVKGDRSFMLQAVRHDPRALAFASDALRGDKQMVLVAAELDWRVLQTKRKGAFSIGIPKKLLNDADVIEAAVGSAVAAVGLRWSAIKLMPPGLQAHKDVRMAVFNARRVTLRRRHTPIITEDDEE